MTGHYITTDWKLRSLTLAVDFSPDRHTSENISVHITDLLDKFEIKAKCTSIGADNARNITNAINSLHIQHLPCAAHTLQLCVHSAINEADVNSILSKLRKIVGHFKHSGANTAELKELMSTNDEPVEKLVSCDFLSYQSYTYIAFEIKSIHCIIV
jgi:hypothetical protein